MRTRFLTLVFVACFLGSLTITFAQGGPNAQPPMPQQAAYLADLFRNLLLTNAAAREQFLASKSPQARRIIEAKLHEYGAMMAEEREARLRALRLRWTTLQLMPLPSAERMARLASLSASDRAVVEAQLGPFIILPPGIQQEVLSNQSVMRDLVRGTISPSKPLQAMTEEERKEEERRQQLLNHFPDFFQLRPSDRTKALAQLTPADRTQMEKTLSGLSNLPSEERAEAIEGFKKFAQLSPVERAAFLKTAERWRTMNEKDRALWRKIVSLLQSPLPPPPLPSAGVGAALDHSSLVGQVR